MKKGQNKELPNDIALCMYLRTYVYCGLGSFKRKSIA
jgi:hypothetical protein